jgi:hypothetical protein
VVGAVILGFGSGSYWFEVGGVPNYKIWDSVGVGNIPEEESRRSRIMAYCCKPASRLLTNDDESIVDFITPSEHMGTSPLERRIDIWKRIG